MAHVIRSPMLADADDLGRVHVRAWDAAYRGGLLPDEYLDELSIEERTTMWRAALTNAPRARFARLAAEAASGAVEGFALVGPADGDPESTVGELFAINVDPGHWGTGIGQALIEAAEVALIEAGFQTAVLWVIPGNARAQAFYERRGWVCDGLTRAQEVLGVTAPEVRYSVSF